MPPCCGRCFIPGFWNTKPPIPIGFISPMKRFLLILWGNSKKCFTISTYRIQMQPVLISSKPPGRGKEGSLFAIRSIMLPNGRNYFQKRKRSQSGKYAGRQPHSYTQTGNNFFIKAAVNCISLRSKPIKAKSHPSIYQKSTLLYSERPGQ